MADFELYSWTKGNALAPVFFLEEANASYHLIPSDPESRTVVKELKKINPLGDVPVLTDRREGINKVSVFGTSAILHYLATELKTLIPESPSLYAIALQWLFWQERVIQGNILIYEATEDEKVMKNCSKILKQSLKKIDSWLKNKSYIASELSIADIALFFLIRRPQDYGILINEYPNLKAWILRMKARTAAKRALSITFY